MAKRLAALPPPPHQHLQEFLDSINELIQNDHWDELRRRGERYLPNVGEAKWNEATGELRFSVQGSAPKPYKVTLGMEGIQEQGRQVATAVVDCGCTCAYSQGYEPCKHTYAALRKLQIRLGNPTDSLHVQLFKASFEPSGKAVFDLLDRYIRQEADRSATKEAPLSERLVWRVRIVPAGQYNAGGLEIDPYVQKINKGGRWTKGRKFTWDRFRYDKSLATTSADKRLQEYATRSHWSPYSYSGYGQSQKVELLLLLVGHPLVFWDDTWERPIEVLEGALGLGLDETPEGGFKLQVQINGQRPGDCVWVETGNESCGAYAADRERSRLYVAKASSSAVDLINGLLRVHNFVPEKSMGELLTRLPQVQRHLPVSLPHQMQGENVPADSRIHLRLTPQATGLVAQMLVRPAADAVEMEPGQGAAEIAAIREGKGVTLVRNLAEEVNRARAIADELRLAHFPEVRAWRWELPTMNDALDLVAFLTDRTGDDLIVEWPEKERLTVSREIAPHALRVQIDDKKDWFGLSGTVEIDGEQVELSRILAGLRAGQRYISLGPQRFVRLAQLFRQRLEALDDVVHETRGGLELDFTAVPVVEELVDDVSLFKACKAWKDTLERLQNAHDLNPDPPITLTAELRDYQLDGYRWLRRLAAWGVGGCLADDMGLGKTVQTLAALIDRMEEGPALVVAPTSVGFNWVRETQKFAPTLRPILYRETDRAEVLEKLGEGDLVVISYGLLLRDVEKLAKVPWGTLVLDEAQKVKNSVTKTAQAVRQLEAKWRLALTGTPLENHLGELWSIFRAVCPGLLGSWDRFREKFAEPVEKGKDHGRRKALSRLLRPFILRRTKSEVLDELPERTENVRYAEFSAPERELYENARLEIVQRLAGVGEGPGGEDRRFEVLAALTRLRQLACHPRLVDAGWDGTSAKLELLMEIVDELREGNHRALVFSQFVQHLTLIRAALDARGIKYLYLDGQTPAKEREVRVDAFQRGEGDLFLISLKAGGTGLNLTAADYVIHMDPWWNPAVEDQATDRAHRIGQTRPVTVYRLVAKDTIEEQILALHGEKRTLVSNVLDGTDQAGKLSSHELVALIKGRDEEAESERSQRSAKVGRE